MQDLLAESAKLAWRIAPGTCREDPSSGERCSWYHGLWPSLRRMGLVEGAERHAAFFREQLVATAASAVAGPTPRAPRILVSGAADYWMLANVLAAFRGRGDGAPPEVTVVDLCETPLHVNRWYAEREGVRIRTVRSDILSYELGSADQPFDAVCSHAILGRFTPAQRAEMLARWRALLRPGGKAITLTPVRPGDDALPVGFSPEHVRAYRGTVLAAAAGLRELLPAAPEDLAAMAERYASRHRVHRVSSAEALREMFERAGFEVDLLARLAPSAPAPGAASAAIQGPTVAGSAEYAGIAATRN